MNKKLVSLSLLFAAAAASFPAFAITGSITKNSAAPTIGILSNGTGPVGLTNFLINSSDSLSGTASKTKTLTLVRYNIAAYPSASSDLVQLCYYLPFQASPAKCVTVNSGASSTTPAFNSYELKSGVELQVRHTITGSAGTQAQPSSQESVTVEYSY
ncbi:hypothetical protein J1786_06990 [Rahnella sp. L72c]|uniref:Uncharacterized protein n=1 Tax=Rahnella perminowiae TaxID=2816244 RepID=A0ABS6KYB5_9GAMM|nr:hypothetical protein [Rahnella perminowiae]MBU9834562.1 hypothetical protein [Rahnella perminowiae]